MINIDYLEYGVVEHCTLKCLGCTVFAPYLKPFFTDIESFRRDVDELKKHVHTKRFRLLGGEPLLHKDILEFISVVKQSGMYEPLNHLYHGLKGVGVCTNGSLLMKMPDAFFEAVEFIDISVYPGTKIDYKALSRFVREKNTQFGFAIRMKDYKSSFTVVNKDEPELDEAKTLQVYKTCAIAQNWKCYHFYDGRFYKCAKPVYQNKYFDKRGIKCDIDFKTDDGIAIHEPDFENRLTAYLADEKPLKSCAYCNGTCGEKFAGRQMTKEEYGL